jgi:hypothetical protein
MAMNSGKSKWMAFLTPGNPESPPVPSDWQLIVDGEEIENVDEFVYLGYKLDVFLTDRQHSKMVNKRYIRAAKIVGRLMRDLKCVNLLSLKRFFTSLVFSQLYGLIFFDAGQIEFDRGVGIFLKASLGLPDSFPHVVASALIKVKHVRLFQMEQRMKFLVRWETKVVDPVFDSLFMDRVYLFPNGEGLNSEMGDQLVKMGLSRTIDYREHFRVISESLSLQLKAELRGGLWATEGRAFWTELSPEGDLEEDLKRELSRLSPEATRIFFLFLADMLCWSALKRPTRNCPSCHSKFTTAHFLSCSTLFVQESGWRIFIELCKARSWEDVIDFVFHVLRSWVSTTDFFTAGF